MLPDKSYVYSVSPLNVSISVVLIWFPDMSNVHSLVCLSNVSISVVSVLFPDRSNVHIQSFKCVHVYSLDAVS